MIKLLFWLFVAVDAGAILLFFVLGLAAAGSTKDSPASVALLLLILPAIPLLAAIAMYLRSTSPGWRALAFVLAAAPVVLVVATQAYTRAQFKANSNAQGDLTFFTAGPMRELVEAIRRNDAPAVAALVPKVDVNETGMADMTLLVSALRQLRTTPDQHEVLRVLLKAGADPNKRVEYEIPLAMALQVSAKSGPEPARSAANGRNWKTVLFLLEHGIDSRAGQTLTGQDFRGMVEANASWASADSGYAEVVQWLKTH